MIEKENLSNYMLKEIEIIQDIIKRLDFDQFLIKGWTVTLVIAVLLLKELKIQVFISFIPLIIFWFLDAHFLRMERMYRELYDWVIKNRLKTDEYLFDLNAYRFKYKEQVKSRFRIMISLTLVLFYGSIALLTIIYAVFLFLSQC